MSEAHPPQAAWAELAEQTEVVRQLLSRTVGVDVGHAFAAMTALDGARTLMSSIRSLTDQDLYGLVENRLRDAVQMLRDLEVDILALRSDQAEEVNLAQRIVELGEYMVRGLDVISAAPDYAQKVTEYQRLRDQALQAIGVQRRVEDALSRVQDAVDVAQDAARETGVARDAAQKAAGETADASMASLWRTYGKSQHRWAMGWRGVGLLVIIATAVANGKLGVPNDTPGAIQHVSLTVVALAVAGYLLAEASRHRRASHWALTLEVQLKTLDAYCASLGDQEAATRLRETFGVRVFGEPPEGSEGDAATPTGHLVEAIEAAVTKRQASS